VSAGVWLGWCVWNPPSLHIWCQKCCVEWWVDRLQVDICGWCPQEEERKESIVIQLPNSINLYLRSDS
jgi:hypothetical protein